MSGRMDHAAEAASLIENAYSDDPVVLDGIKAVAHATLALVEQQRIANEHQRIANRIALAQLLMTQSPRGAEIALVGDSQSALWDNADPATGRSPLKADVAAALGVQAS